MSVLTKLGVAGPVPLIFIAPALPDQKRQGFQTGAHAGEEQVSLDTGCCGAHPPGSARLPGPGCSAAPGERHAQWIVIVGVAGLLGQGHARGPGVDGDLGDESMVTVIGLDR